MRDLQLPVLYRAPIDASDADFDEARELRKRGGRIIASATAIEEELANLLANTLLSEVQVHREEIIGSVLKSSLLGFADKRKLFLVAMRLFPKIENKEWNHLDKLLKSVSQYRNAFAHGSLVHNGEDHELHYFEGEKKIVALNDSYFDELGLVFRDAWTGLEKIARGLDGSGSSAVSVSDRSSEGP